MLFNNKKTGIQYILYRYKYLILFILINILVKDKR